MHQASSSSLLLLFWTVWHRDMSKQHPLLSLFFLWNTLQKNVKSETDIVISRWEGSSFSVLKEFKFIRNGWYSQMGVWYISTPFSFHINMHGAGVSDVEEQWFGLEKNLCYPQEKQSSLLSLERSCPVEVALKRGKRRNGWLKHENVSVL